jgi:geranylgeranyl diphosphate synthase, type II
VKRNPSPRNQQDFIALILSVNNPGLVASEPHLKAALAETLSHQGRLVRAGLVMQAAARHGLDVTAAEQIACALEYWHQASLVFDDLPCMDDAEQRRGTPCLHRTHGEATAILAALALINRAYSLVQRAFVLESAAVRQNACELVDQALGTSGILGGQAWDLRFGSGERAPREVGRIAWRKTGALLWLALSLPLLPSGMWQLERRTLRALSVYWALAYQAMDDLLDVSAQAGGNGKTAGRDAVLRRPNLTIALGVPLARRRIERLLAQADGRVRALCARDVQWTYLADWHELLFMARYRLFIAA